MPSSDRSDASTFRAPATTLSGLPVDVVYPNEHWQPRGGIDAELLQSGPLKIATALEVGLGVDWVEQLRTCLENGQTIICLAFGGPLDLDPKHQPGELTTEQRDIAWQQIEQVLAQLPIEHMPVTFHIPFRWLLDTALVDEFVRGAIDRKVQFKELNLVTLPDLDELGEKAGERNKKLNTALKNFRQMNDASSNVRLLVDARKIRCHGAGAAGEVAFGMTVVKQILEGAREAGVCGQVGCSVGVCLSLNTDLFEEAAKVYVARKLWREFRKQFLPEVVAEDGEDRLFIHGHTADWALDANAVAEENLIRASLQGAAGMLGGADEICVNIIAPGPNGKKPGLEELILALRAPQVLSWENQLGVDLPVLAGSYYFEWLVEEIEERVRKLLEQVEAAGGLTSAIEAGIFT